MQQALEQMGDQVVVESFFPGLEIVSKNPFDLSGNDELCLEVQGGKRNEIVKMS